MMKLIQPGSGRRRPVLFAHYIGGYAFAALKLAAPTACICVDTQSSPLPETPTVRYTRLGNGGAEGILSMHEAMKFACSSAGHFTPSLVAEAGFSGGGQASKTWFENDELPDVVAVADGWHCAFPPGPLASRRDFVAKARAGQRVLAISHTMIVPNGYGSTRHTLELLTAWDLAQGGTAARPATVKPVVHEDGGLLVESYVGADADAHTLQAMVVFPHLVAVALARAAALDLPSAWTAAFTPEPIPGATLAERAIVLAERELAKGVHEIPDGSNSGPDVSRYLSGCVTGGRWVNGEIVGAVLRGTPGHPFDHEPWCIAAIGCLEHDAAEEGDVIAPWRASVAEAVSDARAMNRYHSVAAGDSYVPKRGDKNIYRRGGGNPEHGGPGHAALQVVDVNDAGEYSNLEGNHNNGWGIVPRKLSDADRVGCIASA